ncbi:MAG: RNA 2',3'-cyclic phosphodiesterase [Methylobacter sp.]|uniref:RNA 2',3'-cyclic phosphodiesterase n=1 Tax=Methylobacter sp. TaxID=2051955 RepID=UPI0027312606|nr:RNA 2',3'-cyclic phosphodiesterase [Methylobacter sp.]MDP1665439.1 RNA 2',3'-cyclic phosphodiesterase [Methylobacter sp.]
MPDTSRLFFALWPDDETRQALARLSQANAAQGLKWVRPHNLHVTLVFLGSVDADTELLIKQSVADITAQPFTLNFDRLSYWSKPKILCMTCRQPVPEPATMLASMLETVAANCGLHTDTRPYTPHITLARHVRYLPDMPIEPIVWRAEAFCLLESCSEPDGVCYKVIQQWPFIKPTVNPDQ